MKKIAIITARSGSKGLPNKNVLLVNGKPLIAYSIEAAINTGIFDKIIVSTDSQEYIDLLAHYPIEFIKRAEHLSTDNASSFVVIEDVLQQYQIEFDYFVLLQPTSPLRTALHICEACEKFEKNSQQFDFLVSVSKAHKPTTLTKVIDEDESLKNFDLDYSNYARQHCHPEYSPNGAIFIAKPKPYLKQQHFYGKKSLAYFMETSVSIDIDDKQDFEYFYFITQQRNKDTILLNTIKQRIEYKLANFSTQKSITLIGHSILDQWPIHNIGQYDVNNLAISGISTKEYLELIIDKNLISTLGEKVILMTGTNDIVKSNWTIQTIYSDIQLLINKLFEIRQDIKIYFLEITPTALRIDRNNQKIRELNQFLKQNLTKINWINLDKHFSDQYGKLNLTYTYDGLHLNSAGYELLSSIIEKEI